MNAYVRPARHVFLPIDEIDLSHAIRPYNASVVAELAQSIRAIGLQTPLTCVIRDGRHILVAGRNRLEALCIIGAEQASVRIVDFSDVEAQLWQFSENLHRAELTKLEYDRQVVRYTELLKVKLAEETDSPISPLQERQSEADKVRQVAAIYPETAEVTWWYAQTLDPYGVSDEWELPEEFHRVGREYFARAPGSKIWVEFGDLPAETRKHLWF